MGNVSDLKQKNLLEIIRVIRNHRLISKPEVARLSQLTVVSVNNLLGELLQKQVVVEEGTAKSNGGRRATLYKFNERFGFVIGQFVSIHSVTTSVFDLNLNLLYSNRVGQRMDYSQSMTEMLREQVRLAIHSQPMENGACLGIGISLPGQVDHQSGIVLNLTHLRGWRGVPLRKLMQDEFRIPVYVDNDMNCCAVALKIRNVLKEQDNAVFITINEGVGTGVISRGSVVYGSHSNVGEIGHVTIDYNGPPCNCGGRGCIEVMTSDTMILQKASIAVGGNKGMNEIIREALEGNSEVYRILEETGFFITLALDLIVKAYDPDTIVIQNAWLPHFPEIFHKIVDRVFDRCPWVKRDVLNIMLNTEERLLEIGPAAIVVENLFSSVEPIRLFADL